MKDRHVEVQDLKSLSKLLDVTSAFELIIHPSTEACGGVTAYEI
jgi:hypothetical protein